MNHRLRDLVSSIPSLDSRAMDEARARQATLTKPAGSLGLLEDLAVQLAGIRGGPPEPLARRAVIVMAADHGVAAEGVSAYPSSVTGQMVLNFARGGAAINAIAGVAGARVVVEDMGVGSGTRSFLTEWAMDRPAAERVVLKGADVAEREHEAGLDLVATGDMGIGNTTSASAVVAAITGLPVAEVVGRGTGIDDAMLARKVNVIAKALARHRPDPGDPLDVLAKVGGFEIGGLAGVIIGAAARRVPVLIDGFISGAAALLAVGLAPACRDYLIAAHRSVEPGHRVVLAHLRLRPLLDLGLRLGEGTGAALAMPIVEAAVRAHREMATFAEAQVSERS